MDFYHERRGVIARYVVEAPLPGAAVVLGRSALLAEYPSIPARGRLSLFKQAQRIEGQDPSGWRLYRIVSEDGTGSVPATQGGTTPASGPASPEDDPSSPKSSARTGLAKEEGGGA